MGVPALPVWISPNRFEVPAFAEETMAGPGRKHDCITGINRDLLALRPSDHDDPRSFCKANHLMGRGVELVLSMKSAVPVGAPAVGPKHRAEGGKATGCIGIERITIEQNREPRIVGDPAIGHFDHGDPLQRQHPRFIAIFSRNSGFIGLEHHQNRLSFQHDDRGESEIGFVEPNMILGRSE
jgi:hypothetical protein